MNFVDIAAVLREMAQDVRDNLGGETIMFSIHSNNTVFVTAMDAEKTFALWEETKAGTLSVTAHTKEDLDAAKLRCEQQEPKPVPF